MNSGLLNYRVRQGYRVNDTSEDSRVGRGQSLGGHGAASVAKELGKESYGKAHKTTVGVPGS